MATEKTQTLHDLGRHKETTQKMRTVCHWVKKKKRKKTPDVRKNPTRTRTNSTCVWESGKTRTINSWERGKKPLMKRKQIPLHLTGKLCSAWSAENAHPSLHWWRIHHAGALWERLFRAWWSATWTLEAKGVLRFRFVGAHRGITQLLWCHG